MNDKLTCTQENAEQFREWLKDRGGLAVWTAQDFSGRSWTTPARDPHGNPTAKPHWACRADPDRTITDPNEVEVVRFREVKRFRVGVERDGLTLNLTAGATRKLRAALDRAGKGSTYEFDHSTQEACIMVPDGVQPL